jgi:hypothetical protein
MQIGGLKMKDFSEEFYEAVDGFFKKSKDIAESIDSIKEFVNNSTSVRFGLNNIKSQNEEKISMKNEKKYFLSLSPYTLEDKNLKLIDNVIYGVLKSCVYFSNEPKFKGRCFISIKEIASRINEPKRAVIYSLKRLKENFWIACKKGHDCSNEYLIFNKHQHNLLLGGCTDINKLWKPSNTF